MAEVGPLVLKVFIKGCYDSLMSDVRVEAIHIHPVKSCRRIEVEQADVIATGLKHDREWQIVDENGECVTQRKHKILATVETALDGDTVLLSANGNGSTILSREQAAEVSVQHLVGRRPVRAVDGGGEAANWISELLGERCRFASVTDDSDHRAPSSLDLFEQPIAFVDLAPVLLTNLASLNWLQERALEQFSIDRFRPNVIVDAGEPWIEDTWHDMAIGDAELAGEIPWPRCAVPQINQDSGERNREPAVVLRAHRWCKEAPELEGNVRNMMEGHGVFGMACRIGPVGATIKVGDPLIVHSYREPLLAPPA